MRICSCGKECHPSSNHKKCPSCRMQERKIPCPDCGSLMQPYSSTCVGCIGGTRPKIDRRPEALFILGGVCVVCGTSENLQFDHIDPKTKLFNVSRYFEHGDENVFWAEVAKCQLLCFPHHTEKCIREGSIILVGESNGMAKLRELDVKYIRGLADLGYSQVYIAKEFEVSSPTISNIISGKTWKHVV